MAKEKKANGRPTDYKEEYDRMAYVACSEGGLATSTINCCTCELNSR